MSKLAALHPEYLEDRSRSGALEPHERRRLGAHLAVCDVCAWEASARDDFAREHDAAVDDARLARLVDGALARAIALETPPTRLRAASESARSRVSRRPAATGRWLGAFAMVAVAVVVLLALPARGAREGSHGAPASPTDAALDAGAAEPVAGGDS